MNTTTTQRRPSRAPRRRYEEYEEAPRATPKARDGWLVWTLVCILFVLLIVALSPHAWNALYAWRQALTGQQPAPTIQPAVPTAHVFAPAPAQAGPAAAPQAIDPAQVQSPQNDAPPLLEK